MGFLSPPKPKVVKPRVVAPETTPQDQSGSSTISDPTMGPQSLISTGSAGLTKKPNTKKSSLIGGTVE